MSPLALALTPNVGPKRMQAALAGDLSPESVREILGSEIAEAYSKTLREGKAEREYEQAEKLGIRIIGLWEEGYPEPLRHLDSPPAALYLKGALPPERNIGIVGTRKATPWALAWTRKVAQELAEAGVGVISGLARGVDTEAHRGAIEAGTGYTLGVLGSSLDKLYPAENRTLAQQMSVLSEFPLGTPPLAELFPRRNRIIAAFSQAVLVVEAGEKSGALITAKFALELGRDVLAVPGRPGDLLSLGTNRLIQDGAGLVLSAEDVLMALGVNAPKKQAVNLEPLEAQVYRALLELSESLPDDLAGATGLSVGETLSTLTLLEIKGLVQATPGGRYAPM